MEYWIWYWIDGKGYKITWNSETITGDFMQRHEKYSIIQYKNGTIKFIPSDYMSKVIALHTETDIPIYIY